MKRPKIVINKILLDVNQSSELSRDSSARATKLACEWRCNDRSSRRLINHGQYCQPTVDLNICRWQINLLTPKLSDPLLTEAMRIMLLDDDFVYAYARGQSEVPFASTAPSVHRKLQMLHSTNRSSCQLHADERFSLRRLRRMELAAIASGDVLVAFAENPYRISVALSKEVQRDLLLICTWLWQWVKMHQGTVSGMFKPSSNLYNQKMDLNGVPWEDVDQTDHLSDDVCKVIGPDGEVTRLDRQNDDSFKNINIVNTCANKCLYTFIEKIASFDPTQAQVLSTVWRGSLGAQEVFHKQRNIKIDLNFVCYLQRLSEVSNTSVQARLLRMSKGLR